MSVRLGTLSDSQTWRQPAILNRCAPCCNVMPSIGVRPQAIFKVAFPQHLPKKTPISAEMRRGSVTQPGETVGLAAGAPLPQGLYFVNTGDWGNRSGVDTSLGVDIPVLAWSTPWTIFGGRVQFLIAGPVVEVGVHRTTYLRGVYNPLVSGQLAWDLGNNWG